MLKNAIFDFGGVVYAYNTDDITRAFFPNESERLQVKPILYRDWQSLDEGATDYAEYAESTVQRVPESLREATRHFFRDWLHVEPPKPEIWALIAELKARGVNVYLLSNAPTYFAECLGDYPILKLMDGVVVSGTIQKSKPNADIFEYTLNKFGLNAEESIFIDDNSPNVEAAEKCGLHGFTYHGEIESLRAKIEALMK